jgi:hypothetical protein
MVGEEHLEEAAQAMKKYMDVNRCGFCKRKAEGINRAIVGLREVTGEAQQLAKKIEERKELAGIDAPKTAPPRSFHLSDETKKHLAPSSQFPPQQYGVYPTTVPRLSEEAKKRIVTKFAPQVATRSESSIVEEDKTGLRDMLRNRPKIRDIFYLGD